MYPYRFKIIIIVFILLFFGIIARLFQLQIIESDKYKGISEKRRITTYSLEATRGSIFDRNGKILAVDRHTFDISVQYKSLLYCYVTRTNNLIPRIAGLEAHKKTKKACSECHENYDIWLGRLSQLLEIPETELLDIVVQAVKKVEKLKQNVEKRAGKSTRIKEETDYYPIVFDAVWEKVIQIEIQQREYPGVRVTPKSKRIYPEQKLASHIIGYVSKLTEDELKVYNDNWKNYTLLSSNTGSETTSLLYEGYTENDYVGRTGVEFQYETELRGLKGKRFEEISCKKAQTEKTILERPPAAGNNLYLTLDSRIQRYAEKSLGTNHGAVVVMDPWTGEMLAMASNPRFNPNTINEDFDKLIKNTYKPFLNRATQSALPPGSIFKVITATAALSTGRISAWTNFDCRGYTSLKDITFRCWTNYGHGMISIEDAIPYSCNVFFLETGKALGGELLYAWSKKFGIGEKSGIDLPYEKSGDIPKITSVAEVMNMAIGQGALLATPLQLVRLYAVIANSGTLVQPHLLLKIADSNGKVIRSFKSENNQKMPIQPAVLDILRQSLQDAVTRGTARDKGLAIYNVAGKTGTAETGRQKDNHAWFVGYAPYDNPKYCFVILVEHTPEHASDIACPIAEELLSYLFPEMDGAS